MVSRRPLNGVNLGGWLIVERWITPSLFEGTAAQNEFELSKSKQGRERIARHHRTFITKRDLVWMKRQGIEILRVPVGYWVLGGDTRYVAAVERLDWLMDTSLSLGLKVLLDLHAAPGAQNQAAHSGSGNSGSNKHSTKWLNNTFAQIATIECLKALVQRYKDYPNLWGLELLNEPSVDRFGLKLAWFYRRAYQAVTEVASPGLHIVFSDAYAPLRLTNCFWLRAKREFPVVMDLHVYQVFGEHNKQLSFNQHVKRTTWTRLLLRVLRLMQPVMVGEWSAMLPTRLSAEDTTAYVKAQLKAFDSTMAQFYWTYKGESPGRWNYRHMVESGQIPTIRMLE
jgi:glucan 1,3-beta-glucosidase